MHEGIADIGAGSGRLLIQVPVAALVAARFVFSRPISRFVHRIRGGMAPVAPAPETVLATAVDPAW